VGLFPDPLIGSTVGGFTLETALGRGNMARLYRGVAADGTLAAVKVMLPELVHEIELLARFRREFESTVQIRHPNVVQTWDNGMHDGLPFLVLEFLRGRTVFDIQTDIRAMPLDRALHLAEQIAIGLQACHEHGVVHRDLKPDNVMVLPDDHVKLFDFGLAAPRNAHAARLTATDLRLGTPLYMAPEYIDDGGIDHRTDLYALGIILFELATDSQPFSGPPYQVMHHHRTVVPPRARSVRPELSPVVDTLIAALLEKSPDLRPQSAAEVLKVLRAR
jgi:serine/threonine-protein kinase